MRISERLRAPHHLHVLDTIEDTVAVLAEKATFRFLDSIFGPELEGELRRAVFIEGFFYRENPFFGVCAETLLDWCRQGDFQERLVMISEVVHSFEEGEEGDGAMLSEQARAIIEAAQDPSVVLRNLCPSVRPSSRFGGSLANIIAKRRQASETLLKHDRPDIRAAAATHIAELGKREEQERHDEQTRDRQYDQRFE